MAHPNVGMSYIFSKVVFKIKKKQAPITYVPFTSEHNNPERVGDQAN